MKELFPKLVREEHLLSLKGELWQPSKYGAQSSSRRETSLRIEISWQPPARVFKSGAAFWSRHSALGKLLANSWVCWGWDLVISAHCGSPLGATFESEFPYRAGWDFPIAIPQSALRLFFIHFSFPLSFHSCQGCILASGFSCPLAVPDILLNRSLTLLTPCSLVSAF